jgi:uncharacterized membrane protein (Fun14 family)
MSTKRTPNSADDKKIYYKSIAFVGKIDNMESIVEILGPTTATMRGNFFVGILIGYALKKVIKLLAVIVGLFLAGLVYLQYHQIANINWDKLQQVSENAITTLSNAMTQIPGISSGTESPYYNNSLLISND